MAEYDRLDGAKEFLQGRVRPWLKWACEEINPSLVVPMLLSGIFLKLVELVSLQRGGEVFDIIPVTGVGSDAVLLLDIDPAGRVRDVSIWIDSAVGGPAPTIRISKDASGAGGGGFRVQPGQVSELGAIPGNVKLYVSSTSTINIYTLVRM